MATPPPPSSSSSPPPPPPPPPPPSPPQQPPEYWCHHCDKRVSVESLPGQPDLICLDCRFGFVESIPPSSSSSTTTTTAFIGDTGAIDDTTLGSQFIHVLRLLSQVSRHGHDHPSPPSPPPPPPPLAAADHRDFLRIEISGVDDNDDDEEEDEEESVRSVEIEGDSDDDDDDDDLDDSDEELRRRQRRDLLRLRLRDFATRARSGGRNRILDWAEILMGLETNSMELRFDTHRYIGNPGDYVNEAEYEAILQNLAEADGRRGAPPASKEAVKELKTVAVTEELVCSICKDGVSVGEVVTEMPCGHVYHGDCIATWLQARNSCPVCRFELPTDDAEYEEDKCNKSAGNAAVGGSSASSL